MNPPKANARARAEIPFVLVNKKQPVRYNDQVVRILLCVLAAFLLAMFGAGARFLDSFTSGSFYIKLIAVFLIACFFIEFIFWITFHIDRSFDWKEKPIPCLVLQFSLGMVFPVLSNTSFFRFTIGIWE